MKRRFVLRKFSPLKFFYTLIGMVIFLLFIGLAYSFIASGYNYQFDIDEMFYSQMTYLYAHGFRPYLDVYTSVYTPLFQWIFLPVFWLKGFTFEAMYLGRVMMILLLAIRLTCAWFIVKIIFSKRAAWLFLPLFLFDPLAAFTSMQFRPDNLMLTLFTVGLLFFTIGMTRNKNQHLILSGFFFGFSALVLTKIIPGLFVLGTAFLIYSIVKRKLHVFIGFVCAGILPTFLFCLYLTTQGSLSEMFTQMFIESKLLYTNFTYQIPIYSMMSPNNIFIFGTMGKPVTWVYLWLIIPLGLMGVYNAFQTVLKKDKKSPKDLLVFILGCSFLLQWAVLFVVQVAFIQHYMPVHWIAVVFIAYAIDEMLQVIARYNILYHTTTFFLLGLLIFFSLTSIRLNFNRSTIRGLETQQSYQQRWKQIPSDQSVFTGFLFRPSSYPIPYGGFIVNIPGSIIQRLPDISGMIERTRPLMLINDYTLNRLPADAQMYISNNYTRVQGDDELMVRIGESSK